MGERGSGAGVRVVSGWWAGGERGVRVCGRVAGVWVCAGERTVVNQRV